MRRLDSVDAQFLAIEDGRTHAHVCQLTIMEGKDADGTPVIAQTIHDLIAKRIHLMPPFRWRVKEVPFGLDYPVFVDDTQFDLDSHIWELALPAPGDAKQLGELVGQLASRPLDRSRPLWEVHVILGLADGHVAMLTKLHHAAVDGVSGVEMLSILLDDSPAGREIEAPYEQPTTREPGDLELLARAVVGLPRQPLRMVRALPATLRHIDQLPSMRTIPGAKYVSGAADWAARAATRNRDGRQLERTPVRAPRASLSGRITAHRRFAYGSLPLGTVKAVKNAVPSLTLNDVVVALCAGALRRRLAARGDDVDGPLVAMVPFTVRTGADREYGNRISSMIVAIPTDEPDPRRRLERAHEVMKAAKDRHRAIPATLMQDANHTVPPALFARTARILSMTTAAGWVDPPFNTTISNIPGSPKALYCAGALVVSQHPVNVLIEGLGLSITLLSYQNRLDFGLTADRELVPDVWDLKDDLEAELAELAHAVEARSG